MVVEKHSRFYDRITALPIYITEDNRRKEHISSDNFPKTKVRVLEFFELYPKALEELEQTPNITQVLFSNRSFGVTRGSAGSIKSITRGYETDIQEAYDPYPTPYTKKEGYIEVSTVGNDDDLATTFFHEMKHIHQREKHGQEASKYFKGRYQQRIGEVEARKSAAWKMKKYEKEIGGGNIVQKIDEKVGIKAFMRETKNKPYVLKKTLEVLKRFEPVKRDKELDKVV